MSNPHSPLLAGTAPSKASVRVPNFAAAFFEGALCLFAVQHAGSVFGFDCAPERGAPIPTAHTALATVTAAYRWRIFSILIFHSHPSGLEKYNRKTTLSVLEASQLKDQSCFMPVDKLLLAPNPQPLYDALAQKLRRGDSCSSD